MRHRFIFLAFALVSWPAATATAGDVSGERGLHVSIVGGCHDCHTAGYSESGGMIDPAIAMKGSSVGLRGPWGTTYPLNLRLTVKSLSEDGFLQSMETLRTLPPMPWYNIRAMNEEEVRSLYRYLKSLGDPGNQAPASLAPGEEPTTPFIVLAPPQMPPPCSRDLDCGVGQMCSAGPVRHCIAK